jgi:CheY-like chemotaxis protein
MNKIKVLLVDDEKDFLSVVGLRLESWGYEVNTAENREEVFACLNKEMPDALILDYKLGRDNGIEVLKEIRRLNKNLPVIMLTAYPQEQINRQAQALGVSAFVPKLSAYQDVHQGLKAALDLSMKVAKLRKQKINK